MTAGIDHNHLPPLTGAERMRRTRERKRRGLLRVSVELFARERRALVRAGELTEERLDDARAVQEALYRLLQRFAPQEG
ncbi:MAG: hypothetical protein ACREE4_23640 [Stellaceae bacterium]